MHQACRACLPPVEEAAVEPVPEQVDEHGRRPATPVVDRQPDTGVDPDMLPGVERDLHLRHHIPAHRLSPRQLPRAEQLDHLIRFGKPLATGTAPVV